MKYANQVKGWQNTLKNYDGQLTGFKRTGAAGIKHRDEAALLAWLRTQGDKGKAIAAHTKLEALSAEARKTRERDLVLGQAGGSLGGTATSLYRTAIERAKPDAEREPGYQQRDDASIEGNLKQMERRYAPAMDRKLQAYWLNEYIKLLKAQRVDAFDKCLAKVHSSQSHRYGYFPTRYPASVGKRRTSCAPPSGLCRCRAFSSSANAKAAASRCSSLLPSGEGAPVDFR